PARARAQAPTKPPAGLPACPACGEPLVEGQRGYGCSRWREGCRFVVWKEIAGKAVSAALVRTLVDKGKTRVLKGFVGPDGERRSGRLVLDGGEVRFEAVAGE